MVTWLRIIVSFFCLVLCVLFAALWVRSYFVADSISTIDLSVSPHETGTLQVSRGEANYQYADHPAGLDHMLKIFPRRFPDGVRTSRMWLTYKATSLGKRRSGFKPDFELLGIGFYTEAGRDGQHFLGWRLPFWILVFTSGIIAYAAKPTPRRQFGMRELLVLLTVGAITVGTLVIMLGALSE
jgi:hypothetical protein